MADPKVFSDKINIDIDSTGDITIYLPNGGQIYIPELRSLGIMPSNPQIHHYHSESTVGYLPGNFSLSNLFDIPLSLSPTSVFNAFQGLRHYPAPEASTLFGGSHAVNTGDITNIPGLGSVTHYVYPELNAIVNVTRSDHFLEPGIVVRYVHETGGQIRIVSEGAGTGAFGVANEFLDFAVWGQVDQAIQYMLNDAGTAPIPDVIPESNEFQFCFAKDTMVDVPSGRPVPIESICCGDLVNAFDPSSLENKNTFIPSKISRVIKTKAQLILNFHGLKVTPGHAFLCADGSSAGTFCALIDILRQDGAVVGRDGRHIRASTNELVGGDTDKFVRVTSVVRDASGFVPVNFGRIRVGTLILQPDGSTSTVLDSLRSAGYTLSDGEMITRPGEPPHRLFWLGRVPRPEDYVLESSGLTLGDIFMERISQFREQEVVS